MTDGSPGCRRIFLGRRPPASSDFSMPLTLRRQATRPRAREGVQADPLALGIPRCASSDTLMKAGVTGRTPPAAQASANLDDREPVDAQPVLHATAHGNASRAAPTDGGQRPALPPDDDEVGAQRGSAAVHIAGYQRGRRESALRARTASNARVPPTPRIRRAGVAGGGAATATALGPAATPATSRSRATAPRRGGEPNGARIAAAVTSPDRGNGRDAISGQLVVVVLLSRRSPRQPRAPRPLQDLHRSRGIGAGRRGRRRAWR